MSNRPLDLELPHGEAGTVDLSLPMTVRLEADTALWLLERYLDRVARLGSAAIER